jgi:hypothetical protein
MAPPKRKAGGRVTPKGTKPGVAPKRLPTADAPPITDDRHAHHSRATSSRYTPPTPKYVKESPPWVPVLMFGLLGLGVLMIVLNYIEFLPGAVSNWYLVGGLGLIFAGIVTATQYR